MLHPFGSTRNPTNLNGVRAVDRTKKSALLIASENLRNVKIFKHFPPIAE